MRSALIRGRDGQGTPSSSISNRNILSAVYIAFHDANSEDGMFVKIATL